MGSIIPANEKRYLVRMTTSSGDFRRAVCYVHSATGSDVMAGHGLSNLGELELEVMQLVWANGPITAESIRELLPRSSKDSTVRTILQRLEKKGYIDHSIAGRAYAYWPTETRPHVAAKAVKRVVDWLCNGSIEEVLTEMVHAGMLDSRQLQRLAQHQNAKRRKQ